MGNKNPTFFQKKREEGGVLEAPFDNEAPGGRRSSSFYSFKKTPVCSFEFGDLEKILLFIVVFGFWFLVFGFLVFGFWFLVFAVCCLLFVVCCFVVLCLV